jgi:hypothetical protein
MNNAQIFVEILAIAFGVLTVAAAFSLWSCIRGWCEESLFPWFEKNLPQLAPHVRAAFAAVDNVVIAARRVAWHRLREHLLHQVLKLERRSASAWMRQVTSWVTSILSTGQAVPVRIVAEGACSWDDLPQEVRSEWLRRGKNCQEHDIVALREKELELAAR